GIVKAPDWGWGAWQTIVCFVVFGVGLVLAVRRASWHPSPVIDLQLMRARPFAVSSALILITSTGYYAFLLCIVLFLVGVWQESVLDAGLLVAIAAVVAAVGAPIAGILADKKDARVILFIGCLIFAAAPLWLITQAGTDPAVTSVWI